MRATRLIFLSAILTSTAVLVSVGQGGADRPPLSERVVSYRIDVTLDPSTKRLTGHETLVWRNPSNDNVGELQFHLYLNAFKNTETTLMREAGGVLRGNILGGKDWGWITVKRMGIAGGEDLTTRMEFIQPDDGNENDETVIRVPLRNPVGPRQAVTLEIDFEAQLPKLVRRTGYVDDYFMVAQWFPKLGVYEPAGMRFATKGQWNCHQFHANSEFYADYGEYLVNVTLPTNYVLGSSGVQLSEAASANGTRTVMLRASDVHDFAWTACPRYKVVEDTWGSVKIRLLTFEHRIGELSDRYIAATKVALKFFADWLMPYPYEVITVVDPAFRGEAAGGMEYPTLITGGSFRGLPTGLKNVELVTVHEFGHQYWYGMVGNNEFEEAFLDEGFTQYTEGRIMDAAYGRKTSVLDLAGMRIGDTEMTRHGYIGMRNPKAGSSATWVWKMPRGSYGSLTYEKPAVVLSTLEGLVGRETMDEIMRTYFDRWKFRHPCVKDFLAVVDEVVARRHGDRFGKTMGWYFDQTLFGTDVCDYAATSIMTSRISSPQGVFDSTRMKARAVSNTENPLYESVATVSRLGEVRLPVEVLVRFDDGSAVTESWDGNDRVKVFRYERSARAVQLTVDPSGKIPLDVKPMNNTFAVDPSGVPAWKAAVSVMHWFQNILMTLSLF